MIGGLRMNKIRLKKEYYAPSVWQVWLAYIRFEGSDGGKKRPVLVIGTNGPSCTIAEITGRPPSDAPDVPLMDLITAGLGRESAVRIDKIRTIPKDSLRSYLGKLSCADRDSVKEAIKRRGC